jgi:hypothetical protein
MRVWIIVVVLVALFSAWIWSTEAITLQGERTVYTVDCQQGDWRGAHCTGRLAAGDRYRFRALKSHREVLFWRLGVAEPSSKMSNCEIGDGRNWACKPSPGDSPSITLEMRHGQPLADAGGRTRGFHAVEQWRWWLLLWGIAAGSDADI